MAAPFRLKTALPDEQLLRVHACVSREGLSELGETTLTLLSEKRDILPADLLGKPATLTLALNTDAGAPPRHLSGYVTRFAQSGFEGRYCVYEMTLMPWLWLLTRTADCRIFQELTVPDIVKTVFEDHPAARFEFNLLRPYRRWNYCVQYRETDFNFVARLLEHEGIYWYMQHEEGGHTLMLCDAASAHDAAPGCESLPFYGQAGQVPPQLAYVDRWSMAQSMQPGRVVITDYDFERPSTRLKAKQARRRGYDLSDGEVFDFPGGYAQIGDGSRYAEDRLDEVQSGFECFEAGCNAQGVCTGHLLQLQRHPRDDQNVQYLITAATLQLRQAVHEAGLGQSELRCSFSAMPAGQQFRPARRTAKPMVPGSQTAIVTGPAGEELFTDKYGRVKVQFHWDRLGQNDEKSSCWVSVAYPWAGANFGGISVPRIGQEVIVGFLEGDPDAPIIIGRAYNGEHMPPWDLPANATQSGVLSRSSKGGGYGNANAIRFEDKQGSEQLWLHAEKNQDIEVENDETHWVGHDRKKTIDHDETTHVKHDRSETVDNNETITIHANRSETVDKEETITIHGGRTEQVDQDERITIDGARTETVAKNETLTINGARTETVAKDETISIKGARTETVAKDESITIGGARTEQVAKDESVSIRGARTHAVTQDEKVTIGGARSHAVTKDESVTISGGRQHAVTKDDSLAVSGARSANISKDDKLSVGKALSITAADSITLSTGSASITLKKDGTITIKGKDITVDGSGKIKAKASSDIVMKGSKILQN